MSDDHMERTERGWRLTDKGIRRVMERAAKQADEAARRIVRGADRDLAEAQPVAHEPDTVAEEQLADLRRENGRLLDTLKQIASVPTEHPDAGIAAVTLARRALNRMEVGDA